MVAGHLHEKNGYYYIILNLTDSERRKYSYGICRHMTFKCFIRSNYSG